MTHLAVNVNARLLNTIAATLLIANSNSNLYAGDSTEASLETVAVTASRVPQPIANSASSLSLVDPFSLTQVSHNHIQQSLSRVAGVWASRGNGQEHLTAIRSPVLTGAGSCGAFSVSEDGIPVRPTGFCNVNQLFDINSEQAGRIEVLRGPGTVLHGSDAMHGVINVISAAPSNQLENQLSLEAGANDYYRSKYSISDRQGRHSYRLSINGSSDGGYKDDSGYDQQKLSLRHDYQGIALSAQTLFSASNLNQETAGYIAGKNAYKEDDRKQQNPNPEAFRDSQAYRLQSQLVKNLDNGGQFIVTPFARYSEMDFLMHFLPGTPLEQNGQKSIGLQTSYIRPVNTRLSLQQGVDIELTDAYLKQSQAAGFSRFPAGQQYDYQVDAIVAAAYINAKQRLNDRTSFELGIRFEAIEYDYDNRMLAGSSDENGDPCSVAPCRYSRPADREDSFENLSINASLLHNLTQNLAASLRLSHSYRPPQATELYRLQNGQLEAELDTEQLDSIELGLRGKLSLGQQRLRYSLVAFYMEKDNVIFQDNQRQNLDNGGTDHQGLEYELQWQLNAQWELSANGTFARHRYSKNVSLFGADSSLDVHGNDIDTAPRRMSSVRINWQASTNTSAELEWLAMGKYYTDIDNQRSYAGHDLYNLRVRQQLTADISVGLRINNLSDIDYAERADYSGFVGDRYFVGEPRSYFADLSIRF